MLRGRLIKHARHYLLMLAEGHPHRRLFGQMLRGKSNFRVVVILDTIMRSIAVEVEAAEVEPIDPIRDSNAV
jgi:hypothetical protein